MSITGRRGNGNGMLKAKRNEEILTLLKEDNSMVSIAKKFNVSKARVQQVAKKNGISRWEMSREKYKTTLIEIEADYKAGMGYDEIRNKYNLNGNSTLLSGLRKNGLGAFARRFRHKRDEEIVNEYKTKIAKDVLKSKNPLMDSPERLTNLGSVYKISTKVGFKKYPKVGNRSAGGFFLEQEVIDIIKEMKARKPKKASNQEVSDFLNLRGYKTPQGKEYTTYNVNFKWVKIRKLKL